ncbi:hypothetical protein OH76DRAFT_1415787 [Lentinus brumalis]|uniref:Protein kinase domain-containing protein n=1 Tax=Lentinus brumalis TaxID=2498619 RepID=A0A371DM94_9APHY|nr:hypothetical protein OH76DRAFT_1415787 [Polyporus brumalis]
MVALKIFDCGRRGIEEFMQELEAYVRLNREQWGACSGCTASAGHKPTVAEGHLKPSNIMLRSCATRAREGGPGEEISVRKRELVLVDLVIVDFATSASTEAAGYSMIGTNVYRPPEVTLGEPLFSPSCSVVERMKTLERVIEPVSVDMAHHAWTRFPSLFQVCGTSVRVVAPRGDLATMQRLRRLGRLPNLAVRLGGNRCLSVCLSMLRLQPQSRVTSVEMLQGAGAMHRLFGVSDRRSELAQKLYGSRNVCFARPDHCGPGNMNDIQGLEELLRLGGSDCWLRAWAPTVPFRVATTTTTSAYSSLVSLLRSLSRILCSVHFGIIFTWVLRTLDLDQSSMNGRQRCQASTALRFDSTNSTPCQPPASLGQSSLVRKLRLADALGHASVRFAYIHADPRGVPHSCVVRTLCAADDPPVVSDVDSRYTLCVSVELPLLVPQI